jgi:hypothetical protein
VACSTANVAVREGSNELTNSTCGLMGHQANRWVFLETHSRSALCPLQSN